MTDTGEQIWAERFIEPVTAENLFQLGDIILEGITGKIADEYGVILRHLSSRPGCRVSNPSSFEAVLHNHHYQKKLDLSSFKQTRKSLEYAVQADPDNATIYALLGQIYLDAELFGFEVIPDAIRLGINYARHAVTLDPDNQCAHYCRAYAALVQRDRDTMIRSAERMLKINSNAATMVTFAGFWLCLAGEYEKGMKWFNKGIELNPFFPGWLHAGPFFFYMNKGDFEKALQHANDFELPGFFWGPLIRTASLGLLGRTIEAKHAYDNLLEIKQDFAENARKHIESFTLDENLVTRILKGITAAQQ